MNLRIAAAGLFAAALTVTALGTPAPAHAEDGIVNGQFCKKERLGDTTTDENGVTVTCALGNNKQPQWTDEVQPTAAPTPTASATATPSKTVTITPTKPATRTLASTGH